MPCCCSPSSLRWGRWRGRICRTNASDSNRPPPGMLAAVFWSALAVGVLLKGPLIVMIVGLAASALIVVDRSARWLLALKPLVGVVWLALLVLPWFIAIVGRAGDAFFAESVGQDLLSKVFAGQESHGAPPGYVFPAVLADVLAGRDAWRHWRRRRSGRRAASPRSSSCWRGWCRHGWCWSWCRPSCRIMCCRSIPRSQS